MKRDNWIGFLPFYLLVAILVIGSARLGSAAVTTAVRNGPVSREHTVVIDAGHGGVDGGATSCSGILEKELNLEIALRLNDLMKLLGYETKMIRETDISVYTEGQTIAAKKVSDLKERVRIANSTKNAILVSIHQNTYPSSRYSGAQVFYGAGQGSQALGQQLQSAFVSAVNPGSRRQCKKADGVYLMQNITCTGVLIECGFLSNPEEEAKLRSKEYQQQISAVMASVLSRFLAST